MKTWKIITIVGAILIATTLVIVTAFAQMGGQGFYSPYGANTATGLYGINSGGIMSGGGRGRMMSGYGNFQYGTTTPPTSAGQYGSGRCYGMNGYANPTASNQAVSLTIGQAVNMAKTYLASLNNPDLAIDEVEEYTQNFYVLFYEKSTGIGAFEMLIDKYTGSIAPEIGPNMMWNTRYGVVIGGMMGGLTATQAGPMKVTVNQAKTYAQQFLIANYPGTTVGSIDTFYGYYHVDVFTAGNTYGMLSVNGYTGQVWYHTWHGAFIQAVEL
jgi:hypothetical protein